MVPLGISFQELSPFDNLIQPYTTNLHTYDLHVIKFYEYYFVLAQVLDLVCVTVHACSMQQ